MLRDTERAILQRVIRSEESGRWAGDIERGRTVVAAIDANFTGGEPREEAIADLLGCLLTEIDRLKDRAADEAARSSSLRLPTPGQLVDGDLPPIDAPAEAYRAPKDPRWGPGL